MPCNFVILLVSCNGYLVIMAEVHNKSKNDSHRLHGAKTWRLFSTVFTVFVDETRLLFGDSVNFAVLGGRKLGELSEMILDL